MSIKLPYRVRWQDLKDLFRKAGTVLRADVSLGPDNRSRGYGTVLLATAEDAGRAVDMFNGYTWQTRVLEVRLDRLMPEYDPAAQSVSMGLQGSYGAGPSTVSAGGVVGLSLPTSGPTSRPDLETSVTLTNVNANRLSAMSSPSRSSSTTSLSHPGSSASSASGSGSVPYTSLAPPSFSRPSSSLADRLEFGSVVPPSPAPNSGTSASGAFHDPAVSSRTLFVGNVSSILILN